VADRAAAAQRGEAGTSQREGGERRRGCWDGTWHNSERRGCWDGTWHSSERRGAVGAWHMAGEGGGGGAEKKQRSRGWRKMMRTDL
jgi:hypothetical protein